MSGNCVASNLERHPRRGFMSEMNTGINSNGPF